MGETAKRVKIGLILGLGLVLGLVMVQNTAPVEGRFLWFSAEVPVIVLLIVAATAGFILGLLVTFFVRHEKPNQPFTEYTRRTYTE